MCQMMVDFFFKNIKNVSMIFPSFSVNTVYDHDINISFGLTYFLLTRSKDLGIWS